ncbi:MAG TPA: hypothetical protein DD458_01190 [Prolixibacteraceae bacterium]|nr:hypothetical protein [Marinilabiliales bacterium]HBL73818.1 hypothetical protein [Prolixibacteraceae bacterium]HCU63249.1 hypothetical protein [Prolixibacteraceae bacterium]
MKLYRNSTEIADVKVTDQSYQDASVMAENSINVEFFSQTALDIRKGDYCTAFSVRYTVKERPIPAMKKGIYHYQFKMYAPIHELEKVKLFLYDSSRDLTKSEFSYTCTPAQLLDMIVANLNAVQPFGWTAGTVITGDVKTITISNQNCLEVLQNAATEWKTEYWTDGYAINMCRHEITPDPPRLLTIGGGLLAIDQERNLNSKAITRLYAFGSTKNLPADYGSSRLQMSVPYLEVTGAPFVVEDVQTFDQVYPRRTGTISEVREASGIYYFKDFGLTFDPNDYELPGLTKHVVFQSGSLVGLDFEVNYNSDTEEFELIAYEEQSGLSLPSSPLIPANGDTYIIYNIEMPESYKTAAVAELEAKAQAYLNANQDDLISLNLAQDEVQFTRDDMTLQLGEIVTVQDDNIEPLTEGRNIRVTAFKRYLNKPNKYDSIKVSDVVYVNPVTEVKKTTEEIEKVIERAGMNNPNYFSRNWRDVAEIANMISTLGAEMLIVGKIENQFTLSGIFFTANKGGNKNIFSATSGQLVHSMIPTSDAPVTWDIATFEETLSTDATAYYLYAKCSKANTSGTLIASSVAIGYNSDANYYHFLIGIISSVRGNARTFQTTYGFTQISGNQIVTGKMQTADGYNFLDFDNNKFKIGNTSAGLDWNDAAANTLTLRGALVQNPSGQTSEIGIFRGQYNAAFTYYKGDEVVHGGSSYRMIYSSPISGVDPPNLLVWQVIALKGDTGASGNYIEYQYAKNGSITTAPDIVVTDLNPSGWSVTPPSTGSLEYLWMTKAVKNAAGTSLVSNWTPPVRIKGEVGATGPTGPIGPLTMGGKDYSAVTTYYGNSTRVDIVKYGGSYYVARTDAPGGSFADILPTNTAYWNPFGATFDSVATDLLFASLAYIDNLGVKYLRTGTSGQRVFINGADGSMHFYNALDVETMKLESGILTAIGAILNGATVKSATTGQRVVINGSTNELEFYNASGVLKATLGLSGTIASLRIGSSVEINEANYVFGTSFQADGNGVFASVLGLSSSQSTPSLDNTIFTNTSGDLVFKDRTGALHTIVNI